MAEQTFWCIYGSHNTSHCDISQSSVYNANYCVLVIVQAKKIASVSWVWTCNPVLNVQHWRVVTECIAVLWCCQVLISLSVMNKRCIRIGNRDTILASHGYWSMP